ncbi:MAG: hypothetical protein DMF76_24235 [Acidobacteria bacterium]|nr:MAG: hypothetical protein DMF76_24235 [Acidobacteriota bacterium]
MRKVARSLRRQDRDDCQSRAAAATNRKNAPAPAARKSNVDIPVDPSAKMCPYSASTHAATAMHTATISMEKERLSISEKKVTVEYEFLNNTDKDVTTEIAFPVPPYDETYLDASFNKRIDDFRVWVEGRETKFQTEVKATFDPQFDSERFYVRDGAISPFGPDLAPDPNGEKRRVAGSPPSEVCTVDWTPSDVTQ